MRNRLIIVGAGPAGLSLARALRRSGAEITLVERQSRAALADPLPDGREIALTQASVRHLRDMGVWSLIPPDEVHPLREARVLDGGSPFTLAISSPKRRGADLGVLVSNHLIRRALFASVEAQDGITLLCGREVREARADSDGVSVTLDDGTRLEGDLLVAADSRFSSTRSALGMGAEMIPVGKSMLVCRVRHDKPHAGIATEWFDYKRTVAMLPLAPGMSSLVLTLPHDQAQGLAALPLAELGPQFAALTRDRWGTMEAVGPVVAYPLTMTFAHRFCSPRAALIGDAAVGMHPVTAHGFNLGLAGAMRLARLLQGARDIGETRLLRRFALAHRAATRPLYLATLALVRLYTDDRPGAHALRKAMLHTGALAPVRHALGAMLADRKFARPMCARG
ncbi:MAG: hypothetical protein CVT75_07585 [Alphaproteobacteria bacterium HGW-Alphaproteobacteria-14]|nr:MAG: hypothetical protein CVT75_07585 [Alphaproteobacteria bacterium HGW-Alphaproteobacteria-14]